jgi:hypothetical protein
MYIIETKRSRGAKVRSHPVAGFTARGPGAGAAVARDSVRIVMPFFVENFGCCFFVYFDFFLVGLVD